jgi:hypothetical protein
MFPGVHQSLARYSISLLPLYFLYRSFFEKRFFYLFISGVFLGFALLFSQELGLSSLVALGAMMVVFAYREKIAVRAFAHQIAFIITGMSLLIFPVLAYFFVNHALADFFDTMINSPKSYAVGAFAIKFPILFDIFKYNAEYPRVEILLAYWPIVFYICSIFFFLVLFSRKSFSNRHILFFGIAALGSMMFQRAFGIYSLMTIRNVLYPVMILAIAHMDMAWRRIIELRKGKGIHQYKAEIAFYATVFSLVACGFINYALPMRGFWPSFDTYHYLVGLQARYGRFVQVGLSRAENIWMPVEWGGELKRAVEYITSRTEPDEPIYVFPYAPVVYFLTDRLSPVKYPAIYTMTRESRQYVAQELIRKKVNYIVYVKREEPFLGLSPEQRYPEIVECLNENYEIEKESSNILIFKRKTDFYPDELAE